MLADWDAAAGRLTVYGAAKVPFFNRRILAKQIGLARGRDRDGGERRRRRLRRPRRVLSGGFSHSVCGAPCRAAGEMDRGSPRKSDGDEPCPRSRGRRRDRLRPRRHHPRRCAAMPTSTWAPICAPTARSARATSRSSCRGPTASRTSASTRRCWMTNKTPVGTYRGPGRFETDFFRERLIDMVAADLEHRPRRVPPPQSRPGIRDAVSDADHHAVRVEGRSSTAATIA